MWAGLIFGLLVISALFMPSKRAKEIEAAKAPLPRDITDRDCAYLVELESRFGRRTFSLGSIEGKYVSRKLMDRFGVKSGRLDDRTVLGKRLPELGMLKIVSTGRYQLTEIAADLVEQLKGGSSS